MKLNLSGIFPNFSCQNKKQNDLNLYNQNKLNNFCALNRLNNDVFVKSDKISFKGTEKLGVKDTIIGAGVVGTAFMIPLMIATSLAKCQNPDEIFLSDGTYLGRADELFIDKNKASELGFELDPASFKGPGCVCDEKNGIFKDFTNGIDINLQEGKYINLNKGIYVNPEDQTSVIYTNGDAVPVIIPSFGSGEPHTNNPSVPGVVHHSSFDSSRAAYIESHGHVPEPNGTPFVYSDVNEFRQGSMEDNLSFLEFGKFTPIDRRGFYEKARDFFLGPQESPVIQDCWGRDIITLQDKAGNSHYVALTDELSARMHDEHISYETAKAFLAHVAEHPIENYIRENYPVSNNIHFLNPNMDSFLEHIKHENLDYLDQTFVDSSELITSQDSLLQDNDDFYDFQDIGVADIDVVEPDIDDVADLV